MVVELNMLKFGALKNKGRVLRTTTRESFFELLWTVSDFASRSVDRWGSMCIVSLQSH